jgi:hypothetical protein
MRASVHPAGEPWSVGRANECQCKISVTTALGLGLSGGTLRSRGLRAVGLGTPAFDELYASGGDAWRCRELSRPRFRRFQPGRSHQILATRCDLEGGVRSSRLRRRPCRGRSSEPAPARPASDPEVGRDTGPDGGGSASRPATGQGFFVADLTALVPAASRHHQPGPKGYLTGERPDRLGLPLPNGRRSH